MAIGDFDLRDPGSGIELSTLLAGTASFAGTSSFSGTLGVAVAMTGSFSGSSAFSGTLVTSLALTGSFAGSSSFAGSLLLGVPVAGPFTGSTTFSGTLGVAVAMTGSFSGSASFTGDIVPDGTKISGAVLEVLVANETTTHIAGAVIEAVTAGPTETWVGGAYLEILGADDIPSVRVAGAVLEILLGSEPGQTDVSAAVLEVLCGTVPEPVPWRARSRAAQAARDRYGVDVRLVDYATPTGDWPLIVGLDNVRGAQVRRAVSNAGGLVHRPDYGGNLEASVGGPSRPSALAQRIRDNGIRDPRVRDLRVAVSESAPSQLRVDLGIQPLGESDAIVDATVEVSSG